MQTNSAESGSVGNVLCRIGSILDDGCESCDHTSAPLLWTRSHQGRRGHRQYHKGKEREMFVHLLPRANADPAGVIHCFFFSSLPEISHLLTHSSGFELPHSFSPSDPHPAVCLVFPSSKLADFSPQWFLLTRPQAASRGANTHAPYKAQLAFVRGTATRSLL